MGMLTKENLAQMNRPYFEGLSYESLINAAYNLRNLAVTLAERLEQDSENSSNPPSSDNPYKKSVKRKRLLKRRMKIFLQKARKCRKTPLLSRLQGHLSLTLPDVRRADRREQRDSGVPKPRYRKIRYLTTRKCVRSAAGI